MDDIYKITPELNEPPHVFRNTKFDIETFDRLQDIKRLLSYYWREPLTNAETLRAIILSHPAITEIHPEAGVQGEER